MNDGKLQGFENQIKMSERLKRGKIVRIEKKEYLNSNVVHDGRTLHKWRSFESKVGTCK